MVGIPVQHTKGPANCGYYKAVIKIYHHLWLTYGELNIDAALEGIELYSEHSAEAENHPGQHPNIDRLFDVVENKQTLKMKIIK